MNKKNVKISNKSVETAGPPKDFASAIAEYIWNSFDAKATTVSIKYSTNEVIGGITELSIEDNGSGIELNTIGETFGVLLDSLKNSKASSTSYIHGRKGKGRFAFQKFSTQALWKSTYKDKGTLKQFTLTINNSTKESYEINEENITQGTAKETGCIVVFQGLKENSIQLQSEEFIHFLKREFGWFLHLNKDRKFKILINEEEIDYNSVIFDSAEDTIEIKEKDIVAKFSINYIEWNSKIREQYYYYFLDSNHIEKQKKFTSFNKNGINFHHSVYIVSDFFDSYDRTDIAKNTTLTMFVDDAIYKKLLEELHQYLIAKRKDYIIRNSETLIKSLESEDILPKFGNSEYEQMRKKDLIEITRTVFKIEPKLFINVGEIQKRSFLGLLNLLLDSNERTSLAKILEGIIEMTTEEREELAEILETTNLARITNAVKVIANRIKSIELLKKMIFDNEKYTNERDNIQKVMEKAFWLLGEQYFLLEADKEFKKVLQKYYIKLLNKELPPGEKLEIGSGDAKKRPDLFLVTKSPNTGINNTLYEENLIVELKRPSVIINKTVFRQVQDYLDIVVKTPEFNSATRNWKFYLIGKALSPELKARQKQNSSDVEPFLVDKVDNYRIFAMTWDDVFQMFKMKNKFFLEHISVDKSYIKSKLEGAGVEGIELASFLTKEIGKLNN